MHVDEMSKQVTFFLMEAAELAQRKNADYHPDKVAMLEILRTSWETGIKVEQDLWGRIRKQLSALRRFVIDGHVESEPVKQRMMDVAVYMAMMNFWVENKNGCLWDAAEFVVNQPCESPKVCTEREGVCDRCAFLSWLLRYATIA